GPVSRDSDAARLRAAVALAHLELDGLPLSEQLRTVVADDLGRVHEQVIAVVPEVDEAEPSVGVEPSNCPLGHLELLNSTDIAVVQCPPRAPRPGAPGQARGSATRSRTW